MKQRWDAFWFARAPSDALALARIFLGLSCVLRFTGVYGIAPRAFRGNLDLGLPLHHIGRRSWRFDDIAVPLVDGAPRLSLGEYHSIEAAALVLGALFCVGLGSRVVGPLLGIALLATQLFDQAAFKHNVFTLGVACLIVGLGPCNDRFSIDAYLRLKSGSIMRSVLVTRMLQTLVSSIYLFSVIAKMNPSWFTGAMFRHAHLTTKPVDGSLSALLQESAFAPVLYLALAWGALAMESFLIFGFWFRRLRPWAFAVGFVLHVGLEVSIDVGSFSSTMLALYCVFLSPVTRSELVRFDSSSARGRVLAVLVRVLDWGARFSVVAGCPERGVLDVTDRDGRVRSAGVCALWHVLRRLPLTQPAGLLGGAWCRRLRRRR